MPVVHGPAVQVLRRPIDVHGDPLELCPTRFPLLQDDWGQGYQMAEKIKMSFPQGFQQQNLASLVRPCSQQCVDVVTATLVYNPQKRPSAKSVCIPFARS